MSIVYITNASLKQISKSLRSKKTTTSRNMLIKDISNDFFVEDIVLEEILNELFNNSELKDFYFMKMVLKDFGKFLESIEGNKQIITDLIESSNEKYIYKVKAPSYHSNKKCKLMKKRFHNIEIPQECIQNKEQRYEIEHWINQNKNLSFSELNEKFKIKFDSLEGLILIDRANSGSISFNNEKIVSDFNQEFASKYQQLRFYFNGEFANKIKNMKYAPSSRIKQVLKEEKDTAASEAILDFHTAKNELKQIIFDFYQKKYNVELKFESTVLDTIGFNSCRGCSIYP